MNTFFYSAERSACENGCRYQMCSKRCLAALKKIKTLKKINVLPAGTAFGSSPSQDLRSGDLVILYAADSAQLDALVAIKNIFETFRIILIVGLARSGNDRRCHQLNPRYIDSMENDIGGLEAVIGKMSGTQKDGKRSSMRMTNLN